MTLITATLIVGCGAGTTTKSTATPIYLPPYNFAGGLTHSNADSLEGIRATIAWTVGPVTSAASAQSTWIGIFGPVDPQTHLSFRTAQIGWKQLGPEPPRVFWEWGTSLKDFTVSDGDTVQASESLVVELDRDTAGQYTFIADGALLGHMTLPWQPSYLSIAAETHQPSDLLAGSVKSPEVISKVMWKLNGSWQPLTASTFSTSPQYQATVDSTGRILIWAVRGAPSQSQIVPSGLPNWARTYRTTTNRAQVS